MSMSTNVVGFVSPENENYKKHSKVLIACIEAGVSELPRETTEFFGSKYPYKYLQDEKLQFCDFSQNVAYFTLFSHFYKNCLFRIWRTRHSVKSMTPYCRLINRQSLNIANNNSMT